MTRGWGLLAALVCFALPLSGRAYNVRYEARILPDRGIARLSIEITQNTGVVRSVSFEAEADRLFDERADGELLREQSEEGPPRLLWRIPHEGGKLRYSLRIDRVREDAEYDARCASKWMVVRAEDLFPPMSTRFLSGTDQEANALLRFVLPPRWKIAHPFEMRDGRAVIEQQHRRLDQPKGWIAAGSLDLLEAEVEGSRVVLAAPSSHDARLRDLLAFLRWTLPEMRKALRSLPPRLLIVSAGKPMWRGGLSAPHSVYLHADRPLIESDGSSPLLHELLHTAMRARSEPGEDWIVEGLAEHYSREILKRSGAISEDTYVQTLRELRRKGDRVRRFEGEATGAETALAVAFFHDLGERIREASEGEHGLDDLVATLVGDVQSLDRASLIERIRAATGFEAESYLRARLPPAAEQSAP